ncbi:lipopolysaccharide heptosyltransferase [Neokomagataea thailandica NBRC 106555]|uniref:Glycosyltransferase family 9 protein n=2 Tax=Neokomagataea TaxID=1223423 RepID=A0A4Y6V6B5_9PROT|nr:MULTISPECIES: glycosyltransferase family 9 protein [Neokomagataea]QDH24388.1 glycosyltransferase family 9 protein [Neokomagataea tanensis]GBR53367.1 lipopolysaccharide heptosyltransferase [Neokomagataea thailandica NBRC 106555]
MKILFITANRLGDAVISTGVLAAFMERFPQARFTVVCGPVAAGLFQPNPQVERVIVLEKRKYDRHWIDLWRQCVKTRWARVVDLRGSLISLTLWAGRRHIVRGGRRPGRRVAQLGSALGFEPTPMPRLWHTPEQCAKAEALLPSGKILALAPTANWDGKIWPAERFVAVAEALRQKGLRPAVFYGPGEAERKRAQPVLDALPDAYDLGGDHSLGLVGAVLKRCTLFVGNDSGLMHLSAAAGTATLGLFGPSKQSEYAPAGRAAFAISAPGPEGAAPIEGLSVEMVVEVAFDILGKALLPE